MHTTHDSGETQVRWHGAVDRTALPRLGLPQLDGLLRPTTLYLAAPGADSYSHHGYLASHRGRLYAAWSNHARDEDAPGQRVRGSFSFDCGASWGPAVELFPPLDTVKPRTEQDFVHDIVLIPNGFAEFEDTLYVVAEAHTLGERVSLSPPASEADEPAEIICFTRPGLGRLARAIGMDVGGALVLGPIFWLNGHPPAPLPGFPAYPSAADPAFAGIAAAINAWQAQPEHLPTWDFSHQTATLWAPDGHLLCEPTQAWQLPDGTLARLWRDQAGVCGLLYVQFGSADGRRWTAPVRSAFPDAHTRAAAGNLPDGTAYIINNPGQRQVQRSTSGGVEQLFTGRDPLVLSLAKDGLNFDRHAVIAAGAPPSRFAGVAKSCGFQYPHAAVTNDTLWVIYSVNKEDIEVVGIPLSSLLDHLFKTAGNCSSISTQQEESM